MNRLLKCADCEGTGDVLAGTLDERKCTTCQGTGKSPTVKVLVNGAEIECEVMDEYVPDYSVGMLGEHGWFLAGPNYDEDTKDDSYFLSSESGRVFDKGMDDNYDELVGHTLDCD